MSENSDLTVEQAVQNAIELETNMATQEPEAQPEPEAPIAEPESDEEPAKAEDTFTEKFEKLKQKEAALREQKAELKAVEESRKELEEIKALIGENPAKFMKKYGVSYDKLADSLLNEDQEPDKMSEIEKRLAKFEEAEKRREEEALLQTQQKQVEEYMAKLNQHIEDADGFDLIKATNAQSTVAQTIGEYWQQTEKELDFDTAAKLVEEELRQSEVEKVKKLLEIDWFKEAVGLNDSVKPTTPPVIKATKTISNRNTVEAPERQASKVSSPEEALQRAMAIEEELKKKLQ